MMLVVRNTLRDPYPFCATRPRPSLASHLRMPNPKSTLQKIKADSLQWDITCRNSVYPLSWILSLT